MAVPPTRPPPPSSTSTTPWSGARCIYHFGPRACAGVLHRARPRRDSPGSSCGSAGGENPEHVAEAREQALSFVAGPLGRRDRRHRRGDLRRGDGRARSGPAPGLWPRRTSTPASGSGWSRPRRSSSPQVIARRLGLTGALGTVAESRGRRLHRPAGRRAAARPREGGGGRARWPSARAWTCRAARPTATPPTTCRCCRWSGSRAAINPDAACARTRRRTAGRSATSGPAARRRRSAGAPRPRAAGAGRAGGRGRLGGRADAADRRAYAAGRDGPAAGQKKTERRCMSSE